MASIRFPINGFKQWHPPDPKPPLPPTSKHPAPRYPTPPSPTDLSFPPNTSFCSLQLPATTSYSPHYPIITTPTLDSLPIPKGPSPSLTDLPLSSNSSCPSPSQRPFTTLPHLRHPLPSRPPPAVCVTPTSCHQGSQLPLRHSTDRGGLELGFNADHGYFSELPSPTFSVNASKQSNQEKEPYQLNNNLLLSHILGDISPLPESPMLEIPIDPALLKFNPIYGQVQEGPVAGSAAEGGVNTTQPSPTSFEPDCNGNNEGRSTPDDQSGLIRESPEPPRKRPRISPTSPELAIGLQTLHSHWLRASLDEQLEFLSYLFQNALSQYMPEFPSAHDSSPTPRQLITNHIVSECPRAQSGRVVLNLNTDEPLPSAGKGGRWEADEITLLVELRDNQCLSWPKITKKFDEKWPGRRSQGSIQVKYSTYNAQQRKIRDE